VMSLPLAPPLSTPSSNLLLKNYCPKHRGKHKLRTALNLKSLKRKNPFWAYFGWAILLLPVLFVFYQLASDGIYEGIKSIKKSNRKKEIVTELSTDITDKLESPKVKDVYHIQMVEVKSDLSENQKKSRPIVKYLEYILVGYSKNNVELELSVNNEFETKYVLPKEKIKVSKEDVVKIIGDFERLDIYTMKGDSIKAHALFKIQQIARN
ncbi:hypothetical protein, partial [Pseudozobellia thermophila]